MPTTRMTGDDMLAMWRRGMGSPTTTTWPDSDAMMVINLAANQIAVEHVPDQLEATETITTVANQADYDLAATDIMAINHLGSSFMPRLKPKNRDYAIRLGSQTTSDPWGWFISGGDNDGTWTVTLVATPSITGKSITVYYTRMVPEILTGDEVNTSVLPQIYDLAIVQRAISIGKSLSMQLQGAAQQAPWAEDASRRAYASKHRSEHLWKVGGFEWVNGGRR